MDIRILFLSLLFQVSYGMQSDSTIPMELMPFIVKHTLWQDGKDTAWHVVRRNHSLQLVCKDFRRIFWDCLTLQEKDVVIAILIRDGKVNSHLVDIAVNMQADLFPILKHFVYYSRSQPDAMNIVAAIVDIVDAKVMNQICGHEEITPLHLAIKQSPLKMVKLLLSCPVIDVNKTAPLSTAVYGNRTEKIKLLLVHSDIQVNAVDEYGETPLFALANEMWLDIDRLRFTIDLLIKSGIDSTIKNKDGFTALDIVHDSARQVVAQELEKALAVKK